MELSSALYQVLYYLRQIWEFVWGKVLVAGIAAAFTPNANMLVVLAVLYLLDYACGIAVAIRLHNVSSSRMRRGVSTLVLYATFIFAIGLCENAITDGASHYVTSIAIGVLICTELISVIENLVKLGLPVPFASRMVRMLASKAKDLGVPIGLDATAVSLGYTKDLVSMINVHIPRLQDPSLRRLMKIYYVQWLQFLQWLNTQDWSPTTALAWARLDARYTELFAAAKSEAQSIVASPQVIHQFFDDWIIEGFYKVRGESLKTLKYVHDPADRQDLLGRSAVTMLYQMLNLSAKWDYRLHYCALDKDIDEDSLHELPGTELLRNTGYRLDEVIRTPRDGIDMADEPTPPSATPLAPDSGGFKVQGHEGALEPSTPDESTTKRRRQIESRYHDD